VGFVKRGFLLGSEFCSLSDLNLQAQNWLDRVNSAIHSTTNEIPLKRLKEEGLSDYAAVLPYHNIREEDRKISRDYVSYLGNRYSVPYRYAGRTCSLQISDKTIAIVVSGEVIYTHEIQPGKNSRKRSTSRGCYLKY